MKYAFIVLHRLQFSVRTMCRLLRVHPGGFYAWLKNRLSRRANEDKRQTDLLLQAWEESGKVYGYRKLHDDLLDQGEMCCPNRVARLTRLAGCVSAWNIGSDADLVQFSHVAPIRRA